MEPIELTARREALGLGVYALADHLDVREQNVARWEAGKNPPREWGWIDEALTKLEKFQDSLVEQMVATANEVYKTTGELQLITFTTNDHYWDWIPEARQKFIPVGLHHVATARAAKQLKNEFNRNVVISRAPRADTLTN